MAARANLNVYGPPPSVRVPSHGGGVGGDRVAVGGGGTLLGPALPHTPPTATYAMSPNRPSQRLVVGRGGWHTYPLLWFRKQLGYDIVIARRNPCNLPFGNARPLCTAGVFSILFLTTKVRSQSPFTFPPPTLPPPP